MHIPQCYVLSGYWVQSANSQFVWTDGRCLTTLGKHDNNKLRLTPCDDTLEDQIVEMGTIEMRNGSAALRPLQHLELWRSQKDEFRARLISVAKEEIADRLAEAQRGEPAVEVALRRRGVIFYLDKGTGFLAYLNWWLLTWRLLGLNRADKAYDIVLFAHTDSNKHIHKI